MERPDRYNPKRRRATGESLKVLNEVIIFVKTAVQTPPEDILRQAIDLKRKSTNNRHEINPSYITLIGDTIEVLTEQKGHYSDNSQAQAFFTAAMSETHQVIDTLSRQYPDVDDASIIEIMSQPETADTIALLALRPDEELIPYLENTLEDTGYVTSNNTYVVEDESLTIQSVGCPAAGFTASKDGSYKGKIEPMRAFRELIPWVTQLYLLSDRGRMLE